MYMYMHTYPSNGTVDAFPRNGFEIDKQIKVKLNKRIKMYSNII